MNEDVKFLRASRLRKRGNQPRTIRVLPLRPHDSRLRRTNDEPARLKVTAFEKLTTNYNGNIRGKSDMIQSAVSRTPRSIGVGFSPALERGGEAPQGCACNLLFINRCMRPKGPRQRLAAAHRTTASFYITFSWLRPGSPIILAYPPSLPCSAQQRKEDKQRKENKRKGQSLLSPQRKKGNYILGGPGPPGLSGVCRRKVNDVASSWAALLFLFISHPATCSPKGHCSGFATA